MENAGKILKKIFWFVTAVALLLSVTVATYAWFTANRITSTDSVSGRTGDDTVELQISSYGGTSFSPSEEAAIVQLNSTNAKKLMPVSTSNLNTFVYNKNTVDSMASSFQVVEDENYYYHGRIYIRAVAEGQADGSRLALYLDQGSDSGGDIASAASGDLLNAARLGLTFDNSNNVIFRLSDETNSSDQRMNNTVVDGKTLGDNQVLEYTGGSVKGVDDPAVSLVSYTITTENGIVSLPDQPLLYMELNHIYAVDIYFYLEGCDPDCTDSISYNMADLHLAFYGILTQ